MTNAQFIQLNKAISQLSLKIDGLDVKFTGETARLDSKFNLLNLDFRDLFEFMAKRFDSVESRLEALENNQDHFLKEISTLNEEKIIADYRQGVMEGWVIKAGQKIDLPYQR